MHTVRSGPGTPGWRCVHSVASFVVLLIQLDRFGCPNRKQRISYSLKVLEDRCLKADLNMSSSVFWGEEPLSDLPVHIPVCLSSRAQVLQKLAEGCLSLSKKNKKMALRCVSLLSAHQLEWLPAAVTDYNMPAPLHCNCYRNRCNEWEPVRVGERCVRGRRREILTPTSLHQTKEEKITYCSCGGLKGFALKGFHAPTVGQIASADPGRITQEPICVR